ncbi:hypothetical protein MC28_4597 [Bacillus thuringiensis MC28]|nr:hypothetical protein MC28_4597 [Bacillus thuringiensis MC28]
MFDKNYIFLLSPYKKATTPSCDCLLLKAKVRFRFSSLSSSSG